jgi:hypothetical protein
VRNGGAKPDSFFGDKLKQALLPVNPSEDS